MHELRPIGKGEHLVGYAANLAHALFEGVLRDTGLPYTEDHLNRVANKLREMIKKPHQDVAVAAGWLHDGPEDIEHLDVGYPFSNQASKRESNSVFLNDLLSEAGDAGKMVCAAVDLVTHREGVGYYDAIRHIFDIPQEGEERIAHLIAASLKMVDRRLNLDPDERKNIDEITAKYVALKDAGDAELIAFYKKTKTLDAFKKKGSYRMDVGLFTDTLQENFKEKQRATATDNLAIYLPLAEQRLLVDVGRDNAVFEWNPMRQMMKTMYLDAMALTKLSPFAVERLGLHRKVPHPQEYTPIIKEIRAEGE